MKRWVVAVVLTGGLCAVAGAAWGDQPGWFERLDEVEHQIEQREAQQGQLDAELEQFDRVLHQEVTDPDTAMRATQRLRADIAGRLAHWDGAERRARRLAATGGSADARLLEATLDYNRGDVTASWGDDLELLAQVDAGIDDALGLVVRRGRMQVEYARVHADADTARAQREHLEQQADDQADDEQLGAEIEAAVQQLHQTLDRLNPLAEHEDFYRMKGTLLPPVRAEPDHPFGARQRRESYTEVRHTGLTYEIEAGTEVRSVAEGTVAQIDRLPGFGQVLIVDHGDGHHSVYAHLQEVVVEVGVEVGRGETVALSGESGSLDGPQLYFELRRRGHPVDPQEWFIRE